MGVKEGVGVFWHVYVL